MRKNKKLIMAMAIVLAIATAVAGATFAWFTADDGKLNHFETGQLTDGDVHIQEIFPSGDIAPGVKLDKIVTTVNGGNVDALVRVSFAEVLQMLASGGKAADASPAAVWNGPGAGNPRIPQLFNKALLDDAYSEGNGWFDVEDTTHATNPSPFTLTNPLPAGTKVLYKAFTADKDGPNESTTYTFVVYGKISDTAVAASSDYAKYNGALQYASATITVDDTDPQDLQLDVSDVNFKIFRYDDLIENKWAALTGFSELDDFDLLADPDATPAEALVLSGLPMATSPSDPGAMLELYFGATVKTTLASCEEGDWWYNQNDGYFYYIGKLAPGAETTELLKAVKLSSTAEDAYCNLLYDLIVKMEAIQNIKEALDAVDGWAMSTADAALLAAQLLDVGAFDFS